MKTYGATLTSLKMKTEFTEAADEKPPGVVCRTTSTGIRTGTGNRCAVGSWQVDSIWRLSSPMPASRLRNDLAVLDVI